jgi:predicted ArsR family transcriptional regulator
MPPVHGSSAAVPGASIHRALAEPRRRALLDELRAAPDGLGVDELARRVGLHPNTVRGHLEVLREAALVSGDVDRRGARGRPRMVYVAVADDVAGGEPRPADEGYRFLAEILLSCLLRGTDVPAEEARQAGRAWGRLLVERPRPDERVDAPGAARRLLRVLDERGFAPAQLPNGDIALRRCPFLDLAAQRPDVVCAVHLGLMQGALHELDAPLEVSLLEPFVEPDRCVAHLARRAAGHGEAAQ